MPNGQEQTIKPEDKPIINRIIESAVKKMEKLTGDSVEKQLFTGRTPAQVLQSALQKFGTPEEPSKLLDLTAPELVDLQGQLSQAVVPTGLKTGIIPSIMAGQGLQQRPQVQFIGPEEAGDMINRLLQQQRAMPAFKEKQAAATARGTKEVTREFKLEELGVAAESFKNDISNLVQSFINIPIKGRLGGRPARGIAGLAGFGREEYTRFAAQMAVFPFKAAEFIAGQTGRALSDKDFERMQVLSQFKIGEGEAALRGKLQALIDFTNTKLKAAKRPLMPSAEEFLKGLRGQETQETQPITGQNIKSITPWEE